jgi:hypothetical protein
MSIAEQVERVHERSTQVQGDKLAEVRQQGLYALAGLSAVVVLVAGYIVKRDFFDKTPPPVFDRYQLLQNDKKQTVRLDKTDGSVAVVEDGVIVSETSGSDFYNYLKPKSYAWELNDGSKVTVKLEHHDGKAYCSIKVENASSVLRQKLSLAKGLDELYRVRFSTSAGTVVLDTPFSAGYGWFNTNAKDGSLNLENTAQLPCTAATFNSIGTANIWLY